MKDDSELLKQRIAALEREVATLKNRGFLYRGIRKQSDRYFWGLPLYDIALGPDPAKGEMRGHARGIIAIGDIATGVLVLGGVARGLVAVGGLALGVVLGFGGLSTGLLAVGGLAMGGIAIGGGAVGYYAVGGGALGEHVISGMGQDPEAVRFFNDWLPGLRDLLPHR